MRFQTLGAKPAFVSNIAKIGATAVLKGQPCLLTLSGTNDGLLVMLPSAGSAALALTFPFGVATADIAANQAGEFQQWGLNRYTMLVRQTRAASTDTWASEDTLAIGIALGINTVVNAFTTIASSGTVASNTTISQINSRINAWLAQSLASYASSASSTADSRTAITVAVKSFLRML